MAELRATPQQPVLGAIARALKAREELQASMPATATGTLLDFVLPTSRTVEKWSYGDPLLRLPQQSNIPIVPDRGYLLETLSYAPTVGPAARGVSRAANLAGDVAVRAVTRNPAATSVGVLREASAMSPLSAVIKPKGGNWIAGQVERAVAPIKADYPEPLSDLEKVWAERGLTDTPGAATIRAERVPAEAINKWLDSKLTKYIKNEMATPEDPLRLQADRWAKEQQPKLLAEKQAQLDKAVADMEKAQRERGVEPEMLTRSRARILELQKERDFIASRTGLHIDLSRREFGEPQYRALQGYRRVYGYPTEATAESMQGKKWEDLADYYMQKSPAGDIVQQNYFLRDSDAKRVYNENPWLFKVPPETDVYSLNRGISQNDTGFKHMTDELRNAMNPDSGLPKELQITPKDLEKMNVAQVADLVDRINAHRAVQKAEADALAAQKSIVVHKEYPDSPEGMRWVEMKLIEPTELKLPEGYKMIDDPVRDTSGNPVQQGYRLYSPEGVPLSYGETPTQAYAKYFGKKDLEQALKYEGDVMSHCVGGYCPDVAEGKSRIFSLRDAKGKPQVTIEVIPEQQTWHELLASKKADKYFDMAENQLKDESLSGQDFLNKRAELAKELMIADGVEPKMSQRIEQIKGYKNDRPPEEMMPYINDFIKSGNWSSVGDLHHTNLLKFRDTYVSPSELEYKTEQGWRNLQDYARERFPDEPASQRNFIQGATWALDDYIRIAAPEAKSHGGAVYGYAAGGLVDYNPDEISALAQEIQAGRYAAGGLVEYNPNEISALAAQLEEELLNG